MNAWKLPLSDLSFDEREQKAAVAVLRRKWLTMGEQTGLFEESFAGYLGNGAHCCAVSSGTAALHMALVLGGVGPGDEVILPALTFVADLNAVWMTGATPVLADSCSLQNWNVSGKDIARKITPRTKAVIVVHFAGYPCDMEALTTLCRGRGLLLIEDAAHAAGATLNAKACGTWGNVGCFSFFSNKNMAVGEGGMFVSQDPELVAKARLFRSHGMTASTSERHNGVRTSYDIAMAGLNYRIDEIRAAIGLVQLEKLDWMNARRRRLVRHYHSLLQGLPGLQIPWSHVPRSMSPSYHIFPVLVGDDVQRSRLAAYLRGRGIQTSVHYPSFKSFSYYHDRIDADTPLADEISRRTLTLPLYPGMVKADVAFVCRHVAAFFTEAGEAYHESAGRRRAL